MHVHWHRGFAVSVEALLRDTPTPNDVQLTEAIVQASTQTTPEITNPGPQLAQPGP